LDEAIVCERSALEAWRRLVAAAGDVYTEDLKMGVRGAGLCGHWRDELAALENGLAALERQRRDLRSAPPTKPLPRYDILPAASDGGPVVLHPAITAAPASKPTAITAQVRAPSGVKWVRIRYRSVNQQEDYRTLPMLPTGEKDSFRAVVPSEHILPAWDFMYFIEVMDHRGNGRIYPDLNKETPYLVVRITR
jgi:hypothetical protein